MNDWSSDSDPLVSVITVCLNHEAGLVRTLSSVEKQTWDSIEMVVIDGGSDDGSVEYLRSIGERMALTWVSERDAGIYDAMNKGMSMAHGEIAIFLNAGDLFSSNDIVEYFARSYAKEQWSWGYGCTRTLDVAGRPSAIGALIPYSRTGLALGIVSVPHQAVVMTSDFFHRLGGFSTHAGLAADQELCYRAGAIRAPRLWADFFVDFEGGGVGSSRKASEYPLDMHRARRRQGAPLGGRVWVDFVITACFIAYRQALRWQSRARRSLMGPSV